MQPRLSPDYSKAQHWGDIATCLYLPALAWGLHHTGTLFKLGSYDNVYIVLALAAAEVAKYVFHRYSTEKKPRKINRDLFKSVAVSGALTAVFYVTAVLLGAPIVSAVEQTSMFALILTTVAVLPACLFLGPDNTLAMFLSLTTPEGDDIDRLFMLKIRLPVFGAWLGAVVIPLDWARPWQVWPIPCYLGALAGYAVANAATSFMLFRRSRLKLPKRTGKYAL